MNFNKIAQSFVHATVSSASSLGQATANISSKVGGATLNTALVVGSATLDIISAVGGATLNTASVVGSATLNTASVVGSATLNTALVVGGATLNTASVVGSATLNTASVVGSATLNTASVVGGATLNTASVAGSATLNATKSLGHVGLQTIAELTNSLGYSALMLGPVAGGIAAFDSWSVLNDVKTPWSTYNWYGTQKTLLQNIQMIKDEGIPPNQSVARYRELVRFENSPRPLHLQISEEIALATALVISAPIVAKTCFSAANLVNRIDRLF